MNVEDDASLNQAAHGRLHVDRVAPQPIHGIDVHAVTLAYRVEQPGEARAIGRHDAAAHAFVEEFAIEAAAEGVALCLNGLIAG